jgi:hypothetical protein
MRLIIKLFGQNVVLTYAKLPGKWTMMSKFHDYQRETKSSWFAANTRFGDLPVCHLNFI